MKVIATAPGFFDSYRNTDDVFEVPEGTKGSWFVPVAAEPAKAEKPAKKPGKDESLV